MKSSWMALEQVAIYPKFIASTPAPTTNVIKSLEEALQALLL